MRTILRTVALASLALTGVVTCGHAADLGASDGYKDTPVQGGLVRWSGFYVGVDLGYGAASGDMIDNGSYTNGNPDHGGNASRTAQYSLTGMIGDITLGADIHLPNTKIVFGVFGDYTIGSVSGNSSSAESAWEIDGGIKTAVDCTATDCSNESGKFSIDNQWKAGIRAGFLLNPTTLMYAKFGYSQADLTVEHSSTRTPDPDAKINWSNPKLNGWVVGAGLETQVIGGLFARAEYNYIAYGDYEIYNSTKGDAVRGPLNTDTTRVNLDEHIAKIGLVYKIGSGQ